MGKITKKRYNVISVTNFSENVVTVELQRKKDNKIFFINMRKDLFMVEFN